MLDIASALQIFPRETATHLALSALGALLARGTEPADVTAEALTTEVQAVVGQGIELPSDELDAAAGEM